MTPQTPLSLFLLVIFYATTLLPPSFSFSTVAISETSNQTLVCALISQSYLNCTSLTLGTQNPIRSPNVSLTAITAGNGFVCFLRYPSSASTAIGCYRFSGNGSDVTLKRIYRGDMLNDFESGNSHVCGIVSGSNSIACWQWKGFSPPNLQNISEIAVGEEFVCMILESGQIKCNGTNTNVVGKEPKGNYSSIAAASQEACAISMDGSTVSCWGQIARTVPGNFISMALGENLGCAIQSNDTVTCWGENNFALPESLKNVSFLSITGKKRVFCGISFQNYSLICWGGENLGSGSLIFPNVMPGSCETTQCQCGRLPDYGRFCTQGHICQPCKKAALHPPASAPAPAVQPASPASSCSSRRIIFLVVGSVGSAIFVIVVCYFTYRICKRQVCRVHDSGRLEEAAETTPPEQGALQTTAGQEEEDLYPHNPENFDDSSFRFPTNQGKPLPLQESPKLKRRVSRLASMGSFQLEEFTLEELSKVTENFSHDHQIGSGSFGSVYRAILQDGRDVAVKRAHPLRAGSVRRQEDLDKAFTSELANLSRLNHKNLVRLYGYCDEEDERVLVYEFMVNGTLHDHLHNFHDSPLHSWTARIKVALDAARGIEYLHSYAVPQIIHRDIKPSNILLDSNWVAKVSDFGLSLMGPEDQESHISLRAAGTVGYMDPAYYKFQQLTAKSDVYSFGVVLLELLSGFKAIHRNQETELPRNVVDYVVPYTARDEIHRVLDPKLKSPTPLEIEAVAYVGYLAADCVATDGRDRPGMTEVVNNLERALTVIANPNLLSRSSTGSSIREVE